MIVVATNETHLVKLCDLFAQSLEQGGVQMHANISGLTLPEYLLRGNLSGISVSGQRFAFEVKNPQNQRLQFAFEQRALFPRFLTWAETAQQATCAPLIIPAIFKFTGGVGESTGVMKIYKNKTEDADNLPLAA